MIEFRNVCVDFPDGRGTLAAVRDVSLTIERGEIFGIAGSSGAGKSTLLRTINLLQGVTRGDVLVGGERTTRKRGAQLRALRRRIGMIFQHFNLADNLTVYQNIAFVLRSAGKRRAEVDRRVNECLALVNLADKAQAYPSKLSGGQKQRVAIARALANDAQILLCDEPTSALDAESTASILALIRSLNQRLGITVVIITHELDVIKRICDRCAVMDGGALVEVGNVYELFTEPRAAFTRQLIGHSQPFELPPDVIRATDGPIVRLTFQGDGATEPVISAATERFGVQFNILLGRIEYIGSQPLGVLYVNPVGKPDAVAAALDHLRGVVRKVEVIDRAGI